MYQLLRRPNPTHDKPNLLWHPECLRRWISPISGMSLTADQRETWAWIANRIGGYPGKTSFPVREFADYFGISLQAATERLKRLGAEPFADISFTRGRNGGANAELKDLYELYDIQAAEREGRTRPLTALQERGPIVKYAQPNLDLQEVDDRAGCETESGGQARGDRDPWASADSESENPKASSAQPWNSGEPATGQGRESGWPGAVAGSQIQGCNIARLDLPADDGGGKEAARPLAPPNGSNPKDGSSQTWVFDWDARLGELYSRAPKDMGVFFSSRKETNKQRDGGFFLEFAAQLYRAIDQPGTFFWFAFIAADKIECGDLLEQELRTLVEGATPFAKSLKMAFAGRVHPGAAQQILRGRGIPWLKLYLGSRQESYAAKQRRLEQWRPGKPR